MKTRTDCRLCGSHIIQAYEAEPIPIANNYADMPDHEAERYPIELMQCLGCGHVQLRHVIDGLFEDYKYVTPTALTDSHRDFVLELKRRYPDTRDVLEIGSNNGAYVRMLRAAGFDASGIDPAATGDYNVREYFSSGWALKVGDSLKVDLVIANNVLAHMDDLDDIFHGIDILLSDRGSLVFEVQHFADIVKTGAFDMIYHEHMSYHTVPPLPIFAHKHNLKLTNVEYIPQHGGSIRVTMSRQGNDFQFSPMPIDWNEFITNTNRVRRNVKSALAGRKVAMLGAAAKVTTLIHQCGIVDSISFACDDSPTKIGKYLPGTGIIIKPTSELGDSPALMGAWNYEDVWRKRFPNNELLHPMKL